MIIIISSGQALLTPLKLRPKGLVPATSGLSPLRDFHSIEFRPADIPVWLNASRERMLRTPRPLRLRLRCQREKRCRSKVRHKCRPYHRPGSLASGGQDCGRCPLRVQDPQTCFRLPHCLGRFAPCGYSLPPALRRADYRLAQVIVLPLWFFVFIVVIVQIVWDVINLKGGGCSVVLRLLVFLYHISRQENVIPLYIVLMLMKIWRLLIIPRFAEIKTKRSFLPCGSAKQASLFCSHSLRQFWAYQRGRQCKAFVVEHSLRPTASV